MDTSNNNKDPHCHKTPEHFDAKHHLSSFLCFLHCSLAYTGASMQSPHHLWLGTCQCACCRSQPPQTTNFWSSQTTPMFILSPLHALELGFTARKTRLTTLLGLQALHFNTSIRSFQQEKTNIKNQIISFVASPLCQFPLSSPFPPKTLFTLQYFSPLAVNEHDEPHATTHTYSNFDTPSCYFALYLAGVLLRRLYFTSHYGENGRHTHTLGLAHNGFCCFFSLLAGLGHLCPLNPFLLHHHLRSQRSQTSCPMS